MEIQFLGHSCFRIKGKKSILVTDPFDPYLGFKMPQVSADIITVSHHHKDHNHTKAVTKTIRRKPFVISSPGEYEVAGVFVFGVATHHDRYKGSKRGENTAYIISMDGMRLVHLGDLGHKLTDEQLEEINGVDILFIPVGGVYTIGPKEAAAVVGQIEPKIVIPMHYHLPGLTLKIKLVDPFLKEMGVEVKPASNLIISKEKLPEEREVVVLKKK